MKVLALETQDLVINGLMSAYMVAGYDCRFLKANKAVYDALYEFRPDLILTYSKWISFFEAPAKRHDSKIIIVDYNIHENEIVGYIPKPAANIAQLYGTHDYNYQTRLSYISLASPNDMTLKLLKPFSNNTKFYGFPVPFPTYLGRVNLKQIGKVLHSTLYLLDIYNELVMDAWINGAICIPYRSNPLLFPEELFGRYEHIEELGDKLHQEYKVQKTKEWILNGNTYFDRAIELLLKLGYKTEANECQTIFNQKIKSVS